MKGFGKLAAVFCGVWVLLWCAANVLLLMQRDSESKQYLVDAERIRLALEAGEQPSAEDHPAVTNIVRDDGSGEFFRTSSEYLVIEARGELWRIEYDDSADSGDGRAVIVLNSAMCAGGLLLAAVLVYLGRNIVAPFNELSELPAQLAKGGLNKPLKEQKSRYFGRFIWGMDMLREDLEQANTRRLEQAKAEKTLLLSLSHDIKTPLAAIKLYASALSKGLYTDKEKQREAARSINAKADEIEGYVGQIIKNSSDDFLSFTVENREFYLSEAMERLESYYTDKLETLSIKFEIGEYTDCMLWGDPDRLVEVLQNLTENAVKYGDGHLISISFDSEEDMRLITVRNSGCTLAEGELPHIFDSFWRGSNTDGRQGSGLGLYICRRLMQLMEGDIFAEIRDGEMLVTAVCKKA